MKNTTLTLALALLFLINTSSVFAQETTRGGAQFVAPPAPSGRTDTTVVVPDETRTVTLPAPTTPAPTPRVVLPTPSETTCTKSVSGKCTIFSCSDGINTNTCDFMCKSEGSNTRTQKSVSESLTVIPHEPKIIKVKPEVTYVTADAYVKVDFFPGTNFKGNEYDTVIINNKFADFRVDKTDPKNPDGSTRGSFWLPKGIIAGPTSLILMNKAKPKDSLEWSEKFLVLSPSLSPTILSIIPTHGKAGDTFQIKIFKGMPNYTKAGFVTIDNKNVEFVSSTFTEDDRLYTTTYRLTSKNTSGILRLDTEFSKPVGDTYFTVDKTGVITSVLNYMGSWFK